MAKTLIGTATTDGNGVATITYEAKGEGDVTIVAESGRLSSGPYDIKDAIYYHPTPLTEEAILNIPNLPSNFKASFICKTDDVATLIIGANFGNGITFGVFNDGTEMGISIRQDYRIVASDSQIISPTNTDVELTFSVKNGVHTLSDGTYEISLTDSHVTERNYSFINLGSDDYIKELLIMPL